MIKIRNEQLALKSIIVLALIMFSFTFTTVAYSENRDKFFSNELMVSRMFAHYNKADQFEKSVEMLQVIVDDIQLIIDAYPKILERDERIRLDETIAMAKNKLRQKENSVKIIRNDIAEDLKILRTTIVSRVSETKLKAILEKSNHKRVEELFKIERMFHKLWMDLKGQIDNLGMSAAGFDTSKIEILEPTSTVTFYKYGIKELSIKLSRIKEGIINNGSDEKVGKMYDTEVVNLTHYLEKSKYTAAKIKIKEINNSYKISEEKIDRMHIKLLYKTGKKSDALLELESFRAGPFKRLYTIKCQYALGHYEKVWDQELESEIDNINAEELNEVIYLMIESGIKLGYKSPRFAHLASLVDKDASYSLHVMHALGRYYLNSNDIIMAKDVMYNAINSSKKDLIDNKAAKNIQINLAELAYEAGEYQKALGIYFSLLRNQYNIDRILFGIAWCYYKMGHREHAQKVFRQVLNQKPDSHYAVNAAFYMAKHLYGNALEEWDMVLSINAEEQRITKFIKDIEMRKGDFVGTEQEKKIIAATEKLLQLKSKLKEQKNSGVVDTMFTHSLKVIEFINRHYSIGAFQQAYLDLDEVYLLKKIDSLETVMKKKNSYRSEALNFYGENKKIQEIVNRANVLKTDILLKKHRWEMDYIDLQKTKHANSTGSSEDEVKISNNIIDSLLQLEHEKREKAISSIEKQINKVINSGITMNDKAYFRYHLGEMYYSRNNIQYEIEYEKYEQAMKIYEEQQNSKDRAINPEDHTIPQKPKISHEQSIKEFKKAIEINACEQVSAAASYSLAWCYNDLDMIDSAYKYMKKVAEKFYNSQYAPQALMYCGEHSFDIGRLDAAARYYRAVLNYHESEWFDKALYKLAWTQYRLAYPKQAISTFLALVDLGDMESMEALLQSEALDYVAISLSEIDMVGESGVRRAVNFAKRMKNHKRGHEILHRLANVYREQGRYELSNKTYTEILEHFPAYQKNHIIRKELLEIKKRNLEYNESAKLMMNYYEMYNRYSTWAKEQNDIEVVTEADSIASDMLFNAANQFHHLALQNNMEMHYKEALKAYRRYNEKYSNSRFSDESHYNIAEIYFSIGEYKKAALEYIEVSRQKTNSQYSETAAWNAIVASQNYLRDLEEK
ncbi:tetratricopeptide repeat protein [Chitinispirillales bacterium ANBcel5]|uniref:tetratricopeptide repeat protein n=1 Tax=Cellulosispirillum alkaliphilum TaxID=3039283 RepID=UPI002A548DE1|nr:tetratricopeptide repeat protein [Chitinispirillales bacterium ANBcel5]